MEPVIFIFYLILFGLAVIYLPFFKRSGIGSFELVLIFCVKILAGFSYAWFYKLPQYRAGADTWRFYKLSLYEKEWLLTDPAAFIKDVFVHGYNETGGVFAGENSYWNDLKSNIPVKIMACMNVITNNSYYTNIILFNFLFLIGLIGMYKVFDRIFTGKKWLLITGIFLLPSTLFWCSGVHKDGLVLSATGLVFYHFYKMLYAGRKIMHAAAVILSLVFIFPLRNYVTLALLPALFCWWLAERYPRYKLFIFSLIYLCGLISFFQLRYIFPQLDFPQYIVAKQGEFLQLQGGSAFNVPPLLPSLKSFIAFLPSAVDMAFLQPHITEIAKPAYLPAALEVVFFIIITFLSLLSFNRKQRVAPAAVFCFFFSISILLLTGYTITLAGAIVRYRSLVFPFMITPLLCIIDFSYIRELLLKSKPGRKY